MPTPSTTNDWPINYVEVYAWRQQQVRKLRENSELLIGALGYYAKHPIEFINHWCNTYDPRNAGTSLPTKMPMITFKRQAELVEYLQACLDGVECGLVEKSRDMGATWICCAFSVWLWLFVPGAAIGWGSRKEPLVDKIGDPNSIFEKIRMLINGLPKFFLPVGFNAKIHMSFMRIINPATSSTITGECGDNIGRGGRSLMYFKDESAHYERPEKIEASLSENTRVQIDLSSVNGLGNVFHRRREAGADWTGKIEPGRTQVFVMDWRDHPAKTQKWYDTRKKKFEDDGLSHIFAQEVDRNYSASVEGVIIPAEWVRAAIDAHLKLDIPQTGPWGSALDVADTGGDTNAQAGREGVILRFVEEWGARDPAVTARHSITNIEELGPVDLQYDCIGVGAGVKGEANNLVDQGVMPKDIRFVPWNAAAAVQNPNGYVIEDDEDSPKNKNFYANLKAQAWWELRNRFYHTWRAINEDVTYDVDKLISIDSTIPKLRKLEKELSQATISRGASLKLVVDKSPPGTKSPNMADAVVMAFWPIKSVDSTPVFGTYGNQT